MVTSSEGEHTLTIGITGHRPNGLLGYAADAQYAALRKLLARRIAEIAHGDHARVITGGAQGADQIAFWATEDAKAAGEHIENVVYVPFAGQDGRWRRDGMFGRDAYARMLEAADEVRIITAGVDTTNPTAIRMAMMARNHAIVDDSDMMLAITMHGVTQSERSGTAGTVRYALKTGKAVEDFLVSDALGMARRNGDAMA